MGLLVQVVYVGDQDGPFSERCEDAERCENKVWGKGIKEESLQVQRPRGGHLLGGWARGHSSWIIPDASSHVPGTAWALGSFFPFPGPQALHFPGKLSVLESKSET